MALYAITDTDHYRLTVVRTIDGGSITHVIEKHTISLFVDGDFVLMYWGKFSKQTGQYSPNLFRIPYTDCTPVEANASDLFDTIDAMIHGAVGGGGGGTWGSITGTLSAQTDLQSALDAKEDEANKDTDGTLAANSDVKYASQKAVKTYADTKEPALGFTPEDVANKATDLTSNDNTHYPTTAAVQSAIVSAVEGLLDYRGSYDASGNVFPSSGGSGTAGAILKGDYWRCSVAGTLGGSVIEAGSLIIALQDSPTLAAHWDLVEHNIEYVPENVANKSIDGTFAANSDTLYPSQKAAKTYADTKQMALGFTPENVANKDTDTALAANSDTRYASQKAVKAYIDNQVATVSSKTDYRQSFLLAGM